MLLEQFHYPKTSLNWGLIVTLACVAGLLGVLVIKIVTPKPMDLPPLLTIALPNEDEV